jgi:hypothetical protein
MASALISRDGLIIAADLPEDVSQETFSIMCAAIMGAGMTATTELRQGPPDRIVLDSADMRIAIFTAGRKSILVVALEARADLGAIEERLPEIRKLAETEGR